ncbi:MAG TPA: GNAT family N-acetyltransferase [Cellvibrionaceae bacterium]|nr:GNAT family N-acetyltransferase [Cellvibrionaceae bacterium]HMW49977.1 GNAT family N-acetyltransferase [Cellvibrionaceae bacterium]HMW71980.1 GNAT family N-acetyltransferase [Cellvibrionaceae bacterium]HMY38302.1 GNAT family N-acetyltransferase [Marinagarivorans sp.]HNG58618.1 GNAT family N-acetyltransferase [Cellvibrionaceae bacterium]
MQVILPIQQQEFNLPVSLAAQPDLLDIANYYQTGRGNFWVALANDRVIGTIGLRDLGNGQGALRKMFVACEFRGAPLGVANLLLNTLIEWAKARKISDVYLGTTEYFHAAHRFYEKNLFIAIARESLPPSFPLMAVDTIFYQRSLLSCAR